MIEFIDEPGIIEPDNVVKNVKPVIEATGAKTAVTFFSEHIFNGVIETYGAKKIAMLEGGVTMPAYELKVRGKSIIVYQSTVGAPAAAAAAEEMLACGIDNLVAYGICGGLTKLPARTFIVPTRAYRDDGTSGHYMPPSDFIELPNSAFITEKLNGYGLESVEGCCWTTDGFYRETRKRTEQMTANGCIAVDMESSALQAVCSFRKKNFYTFFITADNLAEESWEPNYIMDSRSFGKGAIVTGAAAAIRLASEL